MTLECDLYILLARHGGLGIRIPSSNAEREMQSSLFITTPLKDHILKQEEEYSYDIMAEQMKNETITSRQNKERSIKEAEDLYSHVPEQLQRVIGVAKEKGTSIWLTLLPLTKHGFSYLHRSASMMCWPCDMADPSRKNLTFFTCHRKCNVRKNGPMRKGCMR